jgi:hypothetical protein
MPAASGPSQKRCPEVEKNPANGPFFSSFSKVYTKEQVAGGYTGKVPFFLPG